MAKGEQHHSAKLTDGDILEIRRRRADGETVSSIAAGFGISSTHVSAIARGDAWAHIGGERTLTARERFDCETVYQRWARGESVTHIAAALGYYARGIRQLIEAAGGAARRDADIVRRYESGESMANIGRDFGICRETVSSILGRAHGY